MQDNTKITTTKTVYPQIYAYTLPNFEQRKGWIKIGYTERKNVDTRIWEQTHTAAVSLEYEKLWAEEAKFSQSDETFKDHQFHCYLRRFKKIKQSPPPNKEWFYYNGTPELAHQDFFDFVHRNYDQAEFNREFEKISGHYQLRTEQEKAVEQTLAYIQNNPNGQFLWNAKPRFGKTLTTYDLVLKLKAKKVLIVTNRPTIANSWFDDFAKFIAHQSDFAFISTSDSLKNRPVLTREEFLSQKEKKSMLAFISLQDLKGAISFGGIYDKLTWVKELEWDLLVIDEAHEGIDTLKTDIAFDNISRCFTLHLSGTPFKAVASGKFASDEIYNWSYADEQNAKANWQNNEQNNPYEDLPRLNLFSYQMGAMITESVNQGANINGEDTSYAFDLNEFFSTNGNGKFIYEKEVKKWLETLSRNEKYPFSDEYRQELKHTFWLLDRVDSAKALQKLLQQHPVFENYGIVLAAGDSKIIDDQLQNQNALERVRKAIKNNTRTITLSVGQLTTGVTVPEWTGVLILSNIKSPALYMQAAFRAQNPWRYSKDGKMYQKQNAYVFDFAPERTLIIYDEFANNLFSKTAGGKGTSDDRKQNIQQLLNFFPVIAEDREGKMTELDVEQVLTIPKMLKAQEVVRRGFMSNLLFQNIGGIFANPEVREILEQLNPMAEGKNVPMSQSNAIDTHNIQLDEDGNPIIDNRIVISQTKANFGEKIYQPVKEITQFTQTPQSEGFLNQLTQTVRQQTEDALKNLAREQGVSQKMVEFEAKKSAETMKREVQKIQAQAEIELKEAEMHYQAAIESETDSQKFQKAEEEYKSKQQEIENNFNKTLLATIETQAQKLAEQATHNILQKAESGKQHQVEDDIRSRLRGFSRTIPSFLMAYGMENISLANFDEIVDDDVFKEVTGISLEQFRQLRDKYQFFDENVFNESVKEFLAKRTALADYFDETLEEDIFDYIPPQKTNQIFTPKKVVKMMLDKLEQECPDIFTDMHKTFADLYMKSGLFLTEIVKRLYKGLEKEIPDKTERLKHIIEKQIYGFAPSEIIYRIARNFVLGFEQGILQIEGKNIICQDLTDYAMGKKSIEELGEKMKFDVVVGNPPYQENAKGESTKDMPIYHYFYDLAEKVGTKYCLISPARFLFNAGSTDKSWNQKMLNDEHLKVVYYNQKSDEVFVGTDIKGGVAVLFRDNSKIFDPIGIFTVFEELNSIIHKVEKLTARTIDEIVANRGQYRYTDAIYEDYPEDMKQISDRRIASNAFQKLPHLFLDIKPEDGEEYVQIFGRFNSNRVYKWFKKRYMTEPNTFLKFKIILPKANGSGAIGEVLSTPLIGTPLIGTPLIGFTETFISIGAFDDEREAQNALKYVKSKFARTMLGVLKITQDNTKEKWAKVPLQDFTDQSDIDWNKSIPEIDQQLYKKYGLDENEIAFIEEKVKAME
ncbi:Eco57I restriction-modification methylase domain-containing protein [Gallibacterium anatis]|uniref:Eco57I restriction-modification methylase domain-containing protein n=1 Tax=Gallibacterium anatis TaxID=750 RepID=UPI001B340866|nr:Eco57I restriction-modification methylase domain-containing protein [Gallibacterium anatis]MBP4133474.1 Eco57I restriction-modification methylase domain-containing protein [Gallibacterium anatis]